MKPDLLFPSNLMEPRCRTKNTAVQVWHTLDFSLLEDSDQALMKIMKKGTSQSP